MMKDLPIEIILFIRSYLLPTTQFYVSLCTVNSYQYSPSIERNSLFVYNEIENRFGWREFLSIRNDEYWRFVRKQTYAMALNRYYSLLYLKLPEFRQMVHNVVHKKRQISLSLEDLNSDITAVEVALFSGLQTVKITSMKINQLPPIDDAFCLILRSCRRLHQIPQLSNIHTLNITDCRALRSIVDADIVELDNRLSAGIYFKNEDSYPIVSSLKILRTTVPNFYSSHLSKFLSLEELTLEKQFYPLEEYDEDDIFYIPCLPLLKRLSLVHVIVDDITHLPALQALELFGTSKIHKLNQNTFQVLKELSVKYDFTLPGVKKRCFPPPESIETFRCLLKGPSFSFFSKCVNIRNLNLGGSRNLPFINPMKNSNSQISIGEKVKNLSLSDCGLAELPPFHSSEQQRFFHLDLSLNNFTNLWPLSMNQIHSLKLDNCKELRNIEPIQYIPYLSLNNCRNIDTFSCLGGTKQKFLDITGCSKLEDHHLPFLKDIPCLFISCCPLITTIESLTNNHYLGLLSLRVPRYQFYGTNYRQVNISASPCTINVYGKINMLVILALTHVEPGPVLPSIENIENICAVHMNF